jgi:hypothetical protein
MEKQAKVREFLFKLNSAIDVSEPLPFELLHTNRSSSAYGKSSGSDNNSDNKFSATDFGVGLPPMANC